MPVCMTVANITNGHIRQPRMYEAYWKEQQELRQERTREVERERANHQEQSPQLCQYWMDYKIPHSAQTPDRHSDTNPVEAARPRHIAWS